MSDDTLDALRRGTRRALVHLVKAGIEGLKAVEALLDELSRSRKQTEEETVRRIDIEVE
ncbi:MAG: hypothetical protein KatS3mg011_1797 [Acidimicrobiia bacterium]|jgi:hypothetical protein|nr:MAG: hypothetical protein KatS3mg011_1797 [Acidimicrobiia bacterium]